MIGKLVMTRVEPCFWGNKPKCGEVSRVKKDASQQENSRVFVKSDGVDTFTSSKDMKTDNKEVNNTDKKSSDKK